MKKDDNVISKDFLWMNRGAGPTIHPGDLIPKPSTKISDSFTLKDMFNFMKYLYKNRSDLWKKMKIDQCEQEHVLATAKYLTELNEATLATKNKTIGELDEEEKIWKLTGTMDEAIIKKYAGDGLTLAEQKNDARVKWT